MKTVYLPLKSLPDWLLAEYPNLLFHSGLAEFVSNHYQGFKLIDYDISIKSKEIKIEMEKREEPIKGDDKRSVMAIAALHKNMN
jgi:hypothetical protein